LARGGKCKGKKATVLQVKKKRGAEVPSGWSRRGITRGNSRKEEWVPKSGKRENKHFITVSEKIRKFPYYSYEEVLGEGQCKIPEPQKKLPLIPGN